MKQKSDIGVIYIITKLELGGAQKICLSLFNNLKKREIDTILISSSDGYLVPKIQSEKSVYLLPGLIREVYFSKLWSEFTIFLELTRKLKKLKKEYNTVIVHTHSTKAGLLGRWAAFFAGIRHRVHTIHGYGFHAYQNNFSWFLIYILEFITAYITSHFICVSSQDAKTGIKLIAGFSKKHSIIRAATDLNANSSARLTQKQKYFIFGTIACFKPQKNLLDLLRAFAVVHIKNPSTRLEIIGDGQQKEALQLWTKEHQLDQAITFHGWQDAVFPIMSRWQVFVLSSLWEGLPCSVVEARSLKLPVLCYNTGGIGDIIFNNQNGLLFKPKDWSSLSLGMLAISKNKKLYTQLSNYQDNLENFDITHMINEHYNLYMSLIK